MDGGGSRKEERETGRKEKLGGRKGRTLQKKGGVDQMKQQESHILLCFEVICS